jgi:hypothetical protein
MASTYFGYDARFADVQRERGSYALLPGDIDRGNASQAELEAALHRVLGPCEWLIYSSASATPEKRKWRYWVPLAEPLPPAEYQAAQEALLELLRAEGIQPDDSATNIARVFYLPNVPRAKRDPVSGQPLFYCWKHNDGDRLRLHPQHPLAIRMAEKAESARREAEERAQRKAMRRDLDAPADADLLEQALFAIDPDLEYMDWVRVGMALKAELGDSGFDLWDRWSAEGTKYAAAGMRAKWRSFNGGQLSAGTIFYLAKGYGWQRPEPQSGPQTPTKPFVDPTPHRDPQGRWTGAGAIATDKPASMPDFVTVKEAAGRIRAAVRRFVEDKPAVMAIAASPGSGKSRHAREILAEALRDLGGDLAFYVPTLPLAEEAAAHFRELGVEAVAVRGRLAPDLGRDEQLTEGDEGLMCLRPQLVRAARKAGLAEGQNICKRGRGEQEERCPHWNKCPWVEQWQIPKDRPVVRCMAHNFLHLPDASGRGEPVLHVVDESCWRGAIGKGEVPLSDWLKMRDPAGFGSWDIFDQDEATGQAADMTKAARDVHAMLQDGRDLFELSLTYTPEDFRTFAKAEDTRPILGLGPKTPDDRLRDTIAGFLVDKHAGKRAAIWRVLADAMEAGRERSERVILRGDKVEVHWRREMPEGATLHLDADADQVILGALYPEVEIGIVRAELRPRAEIVQLTDKTFSKRALLGTLEKPAGEALRREIVQLVTVEVVLDKARNGGGVLAAATKEVVEKIFADAGRKAQQGAELHGGRWIWYGPGSKGMNTWRDFGTVIEIGREELPPSAIEDQARGLWGDGAEPLVLPEADEKDNVMAPAAVLPVLMTDGSAVALEGRAWDDSRLRALQMQSREHSGRQTAERLRMAHAIMPKRWIRLNTVPISTAPVSKLVRWSDLRPDRLTAALAEAALRGGVLRMNPKGLAEDAPGVFATEGAAKRWLESYTPHAPKNILARGAGVLTAAVRKVGQRGPHSTRVIVPAVSCPETAKTMIEAALNAPLGSFEVLESVPTPEDHAINETVKRLESIAKTVGHRPKVTVREVETDVFVADQFPPSAWAEGLRRRGWPVCHVPLQENPRSGRTGP